MQLTTWVMSAALAAAPALDLRGAARLALEQSPRARACAGTLEAAQASVDEARAGTLPSLAVGLQVNRGTGNVVPGSAFGMPGVPATSGPPRGDVFDSGTWGSIASVTSSFELTGLVRRLRTLDAALATEHGERARRDLCALDIAYDAQIAFLNVVATEAAWHALEADRERAATLLTRTRALVEAAIRPGADLAQAEAELAGVETRAAAMRRDLRIARTRLAEALGQSEAPEVDTQLPTLVAQPPAEHPRLASERESVTAVEKRAAAERIAYYPRVELAAALWARGSGYTDPAGGRLGPSSNGLAPDVANWLAGVVVSWDLLDLPEAKARVAKADADARTRQATREAAMLGVQAQIDAAQVAVEEARVVLDRATPAVTAAQAAFVQANARYASGLATALDLARIRELVVNAELASISASIELVRAEVTRARAVGDLSAMTGDH